MIRVWRFSFLFVVFLVLSACGLFGKPTTINNMDEREKIWQTHAKSLASLQQWRLLAKFGITVPHDQVSGLINWRQSANGYMMYFSGPVGKIVATLAKQNDEVILKQDNQPTLRAGSAELLLTDALGWDLPVSGLEFWVKGLPDSRFPFTKTINEFGYLASLQQQNWEINFLAYADYGQFQLPKKIQLKHDDVIVTIVIKSWEL